MLVSFDSSLQLSCVRAVRAKVAVACRGFEQRQQQQSRAEQLVDVVDCPLSDREREGADVVWC